MNEDKPTLGRSLEIQAAVDKIEEMSKNTILSQPITYKPVSKEEYPAIKDAYRESFKGEVNADKEPLPILKLSAGELGQLKNAAVPQGPKINISSTEAQPNEEGGTGYGVGDAGPMMFSREEIKQAQSDLPKIPPAPSFEIPKIEIPKIEIPNIQIPTIKIPNIEIPTIVAPEIKMSEVHTSPEAKALRADIFAKFEATYPGQKFQKEEPVVSTIIEQGAKTKTSNEKPRYRFNNDEQKWDHVSGEDILNSKKQDTPSAPQVAPVEEIVVPKERKEGIAFMITNKLREELKSFGVTAEEIAKLTPAEAWQLLGQKMATGAVPSVARENVEPVKEGVSPAIISELSTYGVSQKDIEMLSTTEVMLLLAKKRSEQKKKPDLILNTSDVQEIIAAAKATSPGTEKEWSEKLLFIASTTKTSKSLEDFLASVGVHESLSSLLTDNKEIFSSYKTKLDELGNSFTKKIKIIEEEIKTIEGQLTKADAQGIAKTQRESIQQNIKERQAEIVRLKQEYAISYNEQISEMLDILRDSKESKTFSTSLKGDEQKFYESLTLEQKRAYRPSLVWDKKMMRAWIEAKRSSREKVVTFLEKITNKLKRVDAKLTEKKMDAAANTFVKKETANLTEKFGKKKIVFATALALGLGGYALKNHEATDVVFEPGKNVAEASAEKPRSEIGTKLVQPAASNTKAETKSTPKVATPTRPQVTPVQSVPVPPIEPPTKLIGFDTVDQEEKGPAVETTPKPTAADAEYEVLPPLAEAGPVVTTIPVAPQATQERVIQNPERIVQEKINSIYERYNIKSRQNAENLGAQQIKSMVFERSGGFTQTPPEVDQNIWNNVIDRGTRALFLHDLQTYLLELEKGSGLAPQPNDSFLNYANRAQSVLLTRGVPTAENKEVSPEVAQLQLEVSNLGKEMRTIPRNILDDITSLSAGQFLKDHVIGDNIMSGTWEFGGKSADPKYKEATTIAVKYLLALKKLGSKRIGETDAAPRPIESIGQYMTRLNTQN